MNRNESILLFEKEILIDFIKTEANYLMRFREKDGL